MSANVRFLGRPAISGRGDGDSPPAEPARPPLSPVSAPATPVAPAAPTGAASPPLADTLQLRDVPEAVAARFQEASACYAHGLWQACAAMCRLTLDEVIGVAGGAGRLRIFDRVRDTQTVAGIDDESFRAVRAILFEGASAERVTRWQAALLIETLRDLLIQEYVRPARLRRALALRRHFAGVSADEHAGVLKQP